MKKILLVGINARYTHLNIAIRYLRNNCKQNKYEIELAEFTINNHLGDILEDIHSKNPDIIGLSVYIWNTNIVKNLLSDLKKVLPNVTIILGGPEVSYNSENWLKKNPDIDYIVIGAGETSFKYLLDNNFEISNKIIKIDNPNFNSISFPYLEHELPNLKNKYLYYEASRGCQFKCSYCLSSRSDQKLEYRDLGKVKKELTLLLEYKPKIVKFVDRTFNSNKLFSREIWKFLIEINPKTRFHFEIHPNLLKEEDYEILRQVPENLFQFEIGIQSTNEKALKAIKRPQKWEDIKLKIEKLITIQNLHIHLDFIVGLPFENFESSKNSINEIYALKPNHFQLGFLKVLSGTEIVNSYKNLTHSNYAPYRILANEWLNFSEISKLKMVETILNIFYNSKKYKLFLENLETHFATAFDMLLNLAIFHKTHDINNQKNWEKNAKILVEFVQTKIDENKDFLIDCLRWDWCKIASAHYYPEILSNKNCYQAKRIGLSKLKEISDENKISTKSLKSAIYFKATSPKFKEKFLPKSEIVAFVKGKKKKQIFEF